MHKAFASEGLSFISAPEIDFLFDFLCKNKDSRNEVSRNDWLAKIHASAPNPLVQIRKIIKSQKYSEKQVMKALGLNPLDEPLDYI